MRRNALKRILRTIKKQKKTERVSKKQKKCREIDSAKIGFAKTKPVWKIDFMETVTINLRAV